ncbi:hypothetical protein BU24DRAFT_356144 [Aaosphaeria arxii CBS 175.79]|uniref:NADH dehydrogenase [ubiquinone] 1 alpha subcomplex assembly factor 3 n=1 Tax=Aaosphaeria arxii CBS 175.79 TaxID=1450172 RepID=A0A6A5XC71_9PLEO|nr:uncharacterized protein BU24DRAFT_356144 [Aaosphaeria arxii CBS 175.79]KAF2010592.1 hypothetical protein BU24DRAFT_356144 [Aaosphaeria arxii CBS 175.79]
MERILLLSSSKPLSRALNVTFSSATTSRSFSSHTVRPTPARVLFRSVPSSRPTPYRCLHATRSSQYASSPPKSRDRGPKSDEDTQTDFGNLDVLRNSVAPATSIDACTGEGFALNNQMRIGGCGVLLVGGEVFRWRPWLVGKEKEEKSSSNSVHDELKGTLKNAKGQWEVQDEAWGLFDLLYPKPDLLIIGTGPHMLPIAPKVRTHLNNLGIRLEIQDTRNAAAQFNLLATERGVSQVAAALIPIGWRESK